MTTNIDASIRGRLLNRARTEGSDFQLYLDRYACERFLYRLGASEDRDRCILKGANPFYSFTVNGRRLSNIVNAYDPPYKRSTNLYAHIKDNIADWVEEAIRIRGRN